jgi:predicted nucleic-acid-binding protein
LGDEAVLITDVVLVEAIWTLKGKRYGLDKEAIVKVINSLFEEPNIAFESGQTVWRSVNDYKNSKSIKSGGKRKEADFQDALVVNSSFGVHSGDKILGKLLI